MPSQEDVKGEGFEIVDHAEPKPPDATEGDDAPAAAAEEQAQPEGKDLHPIDVHALLRVTIAQLASVAWQKMGLQAITPGPHTSKPSPEHKIYPYLLRGVHIVRVNHVWSADITYIPMLNGYMYLVAVIDWYSRYVVSWELSNSMESFFCVSALERALECGIPDIFNTDQGSQFTCSDFTKILLDKDISVSMDGRGRALDNVFIERLWWTVKYEEVYPKEYAAGKALHQGLDRYFRYNNEERKHSSLDKKTPAEVFFKREVKV